MAYLFNTYFLDILGADCRTIPGMLSKSYSIFSKDGYADTWRWRLKFIVRPYGPPKRTDQETGLTVETFLTPEGKVFSYISGMSSNLREVGKLIYQRQLTPQELKDYLDPLREACREKVPDNA